MNEKGTVNYGGGCKSDNKTADNSSNTILFKTLSEGIYDECWLAVTDRAGNRSDSLKVSTFKIDTTAPTILSKYPVNGASSVATDTGFSVTFNEAMDEESMALNDQNNLCIGAVQISNDNFSTCMQVSKQPTD